MDLMPFKSKAQMRYAFATGQPWAKEWADKTKDPSKLPQHVRKRLNGGGKRNK